MFYLQYCIIAKQVAEIFVCGNEDCSGLFCPKVIGGGSLHQQCTFLTHILDSFSLNSEAKVTLNLVKPSIHPTSECGFFCSSQCTYSICNFMLSGSIPCGMVFSSCLPCYQSSGIQVEISQVVFLP